MKSFKKEIEIFNMKSFKKYLVNFYVIFLYVIVNFYLLKIKLLLFLSKRYFDFNISYFSLKYILILM